MSMQWGTRECGSGCLKERSKPWSAQGPPVQLSHFTAGCIQYYLARMDLGKRAMFVASLADDEVQEPCTG